MSAVSVAALVSGASVIVAGGLFGDFLGVSDWRYFVVCARFVFPLPDPIKVTILGVFGYCNVPL